MFRTDLSEQRLLFAFTVRDLVAEDSDVWLYVDLFDSLDLEDFDADYVSQGQQGIEPKLILRAMFYGLTHGIASGRKLGEVCQSDARYLVLSGEQRPTARTFQRFMVRHTSRLDALFIQVVKLAQSMELVKLGRVAIDGSRFKANTSKHKAMSAGRMDQAIAQIREELAHLKADLERMNTTEDSLHDCSLSEEIKHREKRLAKIKAAKEALEKEYAGEALPEKAQKSFADHDALPMAKQGDSFQYAYNCQAVVDAETQIVVAADLHEAPNDYQALPEMLTQTVENCGEVPDAVLADAGYRSASNIATIESCGSESYIALAKGESPADDDVRACIKIVINEDASVSVLCPAGKEMTIKNSHADGSIGVRLPKRACLKCPMQEQCPLKRLTQKTIHLPKPEYLKGVIDNHNRMQSDDGKAIYRRRKVIVEPVFGNIKNKGMKILVRGKSKVRTWWRMACTAHNIEKIIGKMARATSAQPKLVIPIGA
jgi:transposase